MLEFAAGAVGGGAGKLVEYPLDTIKTVSQFDSSVKGPVDCAQRLGLSGLYRGVALPLVASILELGVIWSTTKAISRRLAALSEDGQPALWHAFAGGAISGFLITHILTPAELVKVRMQTGGGSSTLGAIRAAVAADGPSVLFRGYGATLAREVPGTALWIGVYEALVQWATSGDRTREDLSHAEIIGYGSVAGMLYWAVPFPVDTVKTRMQAAAGGGPAPGFISTARALYAKGGVGAFYRGLAPSLVRAAPASAAILYATELTQRGLDSLFPAHGTAVADGWGGDDAGVGGVPSSAASTPAPGGGGSSLALSTPDALLRAALGAQDVVHVAAQCVAEERRGGEAGPWRGSR